MKKAYALEMLIIFFAGSGGILIWIIDKWYWGLLFGGALFSACSYLIGLLKKEVLNEYNELLRKHDVISQKREQKEVKK